MDKQTAEKIIQLNIQDQVIQNEKWELLQDVPREKLFFTWSDLCTEAMRFLIRELETKKN